VKKSSIIYLCLQQLSYNPDLLQPVWAVLRSLTTTKRIFLFLWIFISINLIKTRFASHVTEISHILAGWVNPFRQSTDLRVFHLPVAYIFHRFQHSFFTHCSTIDFKLPPKCQRTLHFPQNCSSTIKINNNKSS